VCEQGEQQGPSGSTQRTWAWCAAQGRPAACLPAVLAGVSRSTCCCDRRRPACTQRTRRGGIMAAAVTALRNKQTSVIERELSAARPQYDSEEDDSHYDAQINAPSVKRHRMPAKHER